MGRVWVVGLLFGGVVWGQDWVMRGEVVDTAGAAIGGAEIRLLDERSHGVLKRAMTNQEGRFEILVPGAVRYLIRVSREGFRERMIAVRPDGGGGDRARITLDTLGCDAPGASCFEIVAGPGPAPRADGPPRVRRHGSLQLGAANEEDLDEGNSKRIDRASDLAVQFGDRQGVFLLPVNGARIADAADLGWYCEWAKYGVDPLRIDGSGKGRDVCVRTNGGGIAHVFLTQEVSVENRVVGLAFVTREK